MPTPANFPQQKSRKDLNLLISMEKSRRYLITHFRSIGGTRLSRQEQMVQSTKTLSLISSLYFGNHGLALNLRSIKR